MHVMRSGCAQRAAPPHVGCQTCPYADYSDGMTDLPRFGVRLARFIDQRAASGLNADSVPELREVIGGSAPNAATLVRLAPALGLHVQDLLVLAGIAVPEELAPLDPRAGSSAIYVAHLANCLPAESQHQLRDLVHSLPQEERTRPATPPKDCDPGPGALLLALLGNRNLGNHLTAKSLFAGTQGSMYLSESTVWNWLVHSRKLTPAVFAGFAAVLGIQVAELAALTGFGLPPRPVPEGPMSAVVAELIWDMRRLTVEQVRHVREAAGTMPGGD